MSSTADMHTKVFWKRPRVPILQKARQQIWRTKGRLATVAIGLLTAGAAEPVDQREVFARAVLKSTAVEWAAVFAEHGQIYTPPRAIFLSPPRHHPSRGFGYARRFGVIIDLGDMADIATVFRSDGDVLNALAIAHEVAHQVQQFSERRGRAVLTGMSRELEADCAAGWWLGRANARNLSVHGKILFAVPDLDRQIPQLFDALHTLHTGRLAASEHEYGSSHGLGSQRADAVRRGLSSAKVSMCGLGLAL